MGFDPKPVKYTDLTCMDCFTKFDTVSTTGPVRLCDFCFARRVREIYADECGHHVFPVAGDSVSCGLRKEPTLHDWIFLGIDVRHFDDGLLTEARVFACANCGRDRMKSLNPRPKKVQPPPLDPVVKAQRDDLRRQLFAARIGGEARAKILADFDREHQLMKGE